MFSSRDPTTEPARSASSPFALAALVIANIVPLIGVLFLDWSLFLIMFVFWLENWVVGAFNVARMAIAAGDLQRSAGEGEIGLAESLKSLPMRIFPMFFFCVHYGLFCFVHGVFVFSLFGRDRALGVGSPFDLARGVSGVLDVRPDLLLAVAALVVSHGVSYVSNYVRGGEWKGMALKDQMFQPYARVVLLHVTILFGGFAVMLLGAPIVALLIMVVLKIGLDLYAHRREHGEQRGLIMWFRETFVQRGHS